MNKILLQTKQWLSSPKPFIEHESWTRKFPILCGLFVILFLLIFSPFGITFHTVHVYLFIAGFGIITTVVNETIILIVERIPGNKNWKMYQTLSASFVTLFLISIINWIYFNIFGNDVFGPYPHSLADFFIYTYAVGLFPTLFFILFKNPEGRNQKAQQQKETNTPFPDPQLSSATSVELLTIQGEGNKEHCKFREDELLYVKADGNYATIFFLKDERVEKVMIRSSLKRIEEQLSNVSAFVRCHRSYIINSQYVSSIVGNARGRSAKLMHTDVTIPVSRSFQAEFAVNP